MRIHGPHSENRRSTGRDYDVAVLGKALDLLESLAGGHEFGLSTLSERTGVSKASAFRILSTLEGRAYVVKDPASRKYRPGPKLIALSCSFVSGMDLVRVARPVLEALHAEFDETVNLGILSEGQVLYLDMLESRHGLRMAARVGKRDPLHSTALGKAILSRLPPEELDRLLGGARWARTTPRTLTGRQALARDLASVRSRGYAVDDEENEPGARCVGAPIVEPGGWPVAAMSVSGPTARLSDAMMRRIGGRLLAAVREVEHCLGYDARGAATG